MLRRKNAKNLIQMNNWYGRQMAPFKKTPIRFHHNCDAKSQEKRFLNNEIFINKKLLNFLNEFSRENPELFKQMKIVANFDANEIPSNIFYKTEEILKKYARLIKLLGSVIILIIADYFLKLHSDVNSRLDEIGSFITKHSENNQAFIAHTDNEEFEPVLPIYASASKEDIDYYLNKAKKTSIAIEMNIKLSKDLEKIKNEKNNFLLKIFGHFYRIEMFSQELEDQQYLLEIENFLNKTFITFKLKEFDKSLNYINDAISKVKKYEIFIKKMKEKTQKSADNIEKFTDKYVDFKLNKIRIIYVNTQLIKAKIFRAKAIYSNNKIYFNLEKSKNCADAVYKNVSEYIHKNKMSDNPMVLTHHGFCLNDYGEHEEAFKKHAEAFKHGSGRVVVLDGLGYTLYHLGLKLQKQINNILDDKKDNKTIKNIQNLSTLLNGSGIVEIPNITDKGIEVHTDKGVEVRAFTKANISFVNDKIYQKALGVLNRVIQLNPNQAIHLTHRGELLLALGNYEKALQDFDRAISLNKNYPFSRLGRSIALYELSIKKTGSEKKQYLSRALNDLSIASTFYNNTVIPASFDANKAEFFSNLPFQTAYFLERYNEYLPKVKHELDNYSESNFDRLYSFFYKNNLKIEEAPEIVEMFDANKKYEYIFKKI